MNHFTLIGLALAAVAAVLPTSPAFERPALAQEQSSSATPGDEVRARSAEQAMADARARRERADDAYKENQAAAADLEAKLLALTGRAETSRESLAKAATRMDEEAES